MPPAAPIVARRSGNGHCPKAAAAATGPGPPEALPPDALRPSQRGLALSRRGREQPTHPGCATRPRGGRAGGRGACSLAHARAGGGSVAPPQPRENPPQAAAVAPSSSATTSRVCCAMLSSSSVGMTSTFTLLSAAWISADSPYLPPAGVGGGGGAGKGRELQLSVMSAMVYDI